MIKYLLYPFSWLFAIVVYVRNKLYDWNMLPSINSKLPVISVGNIQVGGTGKTPFVIALCKQLISNNIRPLIITRGYKRNTKHQIILNNINQYSAQEVGDEPYYIKTEVPDVPIIIDYNKKRAVKTANKLSNIDCIVLDDGLQSRYITKNLDIVLLDKSDFLNTALLPVGRFREPVVNLKRADFVYNKGEKPLNITYQIHQYIKDNKTIMNMIDVKEPCVAFCGIGNTNNFIESLKNNNITIKQTVVFENHAKYDDQKYEKLKGLNPNNLSFVTTYKDFVKLDKKFKNIYTIYVLELTIEIEDNKLLNTIKGLVNEN